MFSGASRHIVHPGWLECQAIEPRPPDPPSVALASQCLPDAASLAADSISKWAAQAGERLIERLRGHTGGWRLHLFCLPAAERASLLSRTRYIEQAIENLLRKKQRRLLRTLNHDAQAPLAADEWLLQIGLRTAKTGYFSAVAPRELSRLRRSVSRFPGGAVEAPSDRQAPSRAFCKLAEVESRLARPIMAGERCVDLGSSPGSWAYWALNRGAEVVAIDRSPLRADLMRRPRLTYLREDAFRYRPPTPVDWLLCDVIAFPGKSIELLQTWLSAGWCRRFCVTIKFRGQSYYDQLEPLKAWLSAAGHDFYLRRLSSNKNEVMVYGRAAPAPPGDPLAGL